MIDSLCDQARGGGLAVAWSYCDFLAPREQTVVNIIGAILKRLVGRQIPKNIREAYHEGRRPLLADLKRILKVAIALLPQVYICIDVLEFTEADSCFLCSRRKDRRDSSFSCFICSRRKDR